MREVVAAGFLLVVCGYLATGAWLFLRERRQGKVVYMRNRESEPAVEVSARHFFWTRLLLLSGGVFFGLAPLATLDFTLWAVLLYIVAVAGTLAVFLANYRRERHDPRYTRQR